MAIASGHFAQVAQAVSERTAELLCSRVVVINDRGVVVASSEAGASPLDAIDPDLSFVRVPLRLEGETGEILISEPSAGEVVSPRLARALADLIISQAAVVDRLPARHELKNKFIHDLLQGPPVHESAVFREAQILGMDLGYPRVVLLIDAADYILRHVDHADRPANPDPSDPGIGRRAQLVIGSIVDFFELPNDTICAHIGDGEVAVLKASNRITWVDQDSDPEDASPSWASLTAIKQAGTALLARLRHVTRSDVTIGIGRYHSGLHGLSRSYQDARAALTLGSRFHGSNRVHCLNELGIAALIGISDEGTKVDLARYLLSPLDDHPYLLDTLDTFLASNCSPSETSERLSVHRNTLAYRLEKISNLTGLDPRRFDDAVQIRIALLLRALRLDSPH